VHKSLVGAQAEASQREQRGGHQTGREAVSAAVTHRSGWRLREEHCFVCSKIKTRKIVLWLLIRQGKKARVSSEEEGLAGLRSKECRAGLFEAAVPGAYATNCPCHVRTNQSIALSLY